MDRAIFENPESYTPETRIPHDVCVKRDFYEGNEQPTNTVENVLSDIEGKFETVVQQKILKKKELDRNDRQAIANFVATMQVRTMGFKKHMDSFYDQVISKLEAMEKAHGASSETSDEWKKSKKDKDMFIIGIIQSLSMNLHSVTSWLIFEAKLDDCHFITSDNPFCRYDFSLLNSFHGVPAFSKTTEITLPVTPRFAIVGNLLDLNGYIDATHNQVDEINERTLMSIHTEFYSSRKLKPYELKKLSNRHRQALALSIFAERAETILEKRLKKRQRQERIANRVVKIFRIHKILLLLLRLGIIRPESLGLRRKVDDSEEIED